MNCCYASLFFNDYDSPNICWYIYIWCIFNIYCGYIRNKYFCFWHRNKIMLGLHHLLLWDLSYLRIWSVLFSPLKSGPKINSVQFASNVLKRKNKWIFFFNVLQKFWYGVSISCRTIFGEFFFLESSQKVPRYLFLILVTLSFKNICIKKKVTHCLTRFWGIINFFYELILKLLIPQKCIEQWDAFFRWYECF